MGRIVKQLSDNTVRYYWYPGERQEWLRALTAVGVGGGSALLLMTVTGDSLAAVVAGCTVTLAMAGFNFGRRDAAALTGFPAMNDKAARRAAIVHSGRAAWRATIQGLAGAAAAVLVLNMPHTGIAADWVLPVVPAIIAALAHQTGMIWSQLASSVATAGPAKPKPSPAPSPEL